MDAPGEDESPDELLPLPFEALPLLASVEADGFPASLEVEFVLVAGFGLEYRSLYQPLPLNEIAGAEITRSSGPLQYGQSVISGSENFWRFSVWRPHCLHLYSYKGIVVSLSPRPAYTGHGRS